MNSQLCMGSFCPGEESKPSRSPGEKLEAPSWAEYWAFARVRLGMRKAEFFRLTPRLFAELVKVECDRQRELRIPTAVLRRDLINFSFCRPKKEVSLEDLLPGEDWTVSSGVPTGKRRRMTAKRRAALAETLHTVFRGLPGVKFIPGK